MAQKLDANLNVIQETPIELELINGDLSIISKLDDEPNDVGGLTSTQLKAKFDEAGNIIKEYLNNSLIPAVLAADATEATRSAAEAERVENELERVANENVRVPAETARIAAENIRIENEATRVASEEERIDAEAIRKSNEAQRIANENAREDLETGYVARAEAAAKRAEDAAADAENTVGGDYVTQEELDAAIGAIPTPDVYTKTETLTNDTKGLFGLGSGAVPNDAFAKIGIGGMNYIPTSVVDTPIFEKWESYDRYPFNTSENALRDFKRFDDGFYMLSQHTSSAPYSFTLWRSDDLEVWTQCKQFFTSESQNDTKQGTYGNKIFKHNGKFVVVLYQAQSNGEKYTYFYSANAADGTYAYERINDYSEWVREAGGIICLRGNRNTNSKLYFYDIDTGKVATSGDNLGSTARRCDFAYHNGEYFYTATANSQYYYGSTDKLSFAYNDSGALTVTRVDKIADSSSRYGGFFFKFNGDLYVDCIQAQGANEAIVKINTANMASSQVVKTYGSGTMPGMRYAVERLGQLWLACAKNPSNTSEGVGFYTPSADFSTYTKVLGFSTSAEWQSHGAEYTSVAWPVNEEERVVDNNFNITETTYKVIPKIVDYHGADVVLPSAQLDVGGAKIATGSYVGTDKYGASNPNTLTFGFEPRIVIVTQDGNNSLAPSGVGTWDGGFMWTYGAIRVKCGGNSNYELETALNGTTLTWYSENSSYTQQNSTFTYNYIAIG